MPEPNRFGTRLVLLSAGALLACASAGMGGSFEVGVVPQAARAASVVTARRAEICLVTDGLPRKS